MSDSRKKMKAEVFFERYFGNFHRILLTNLIFAVPSAAVFALFWFLGQALLGGFSLAFLMLAIIPLYPFYAGVVMVSRDIARGDSDVEVFKVFVAAVRDNFARFLLHGAAVCAASVFSYLSVSLYISLLSVSWLMYIVLFFCFLVALLMLYASFYLPLLSVTYDLKLKYLYKNSFLMSFGEIKNNFFATLALALVALICVTVTMISRSVLMLVIILAALWALFIPATCSFCCCFFIYGGMTAVMREKSERSAEKSSAPSADRPSLKLEDEDYSDIDISKLKDNDDFIFYNGKMMKQSALLRLLREREAEKEGDPDE